MKQTHLKTLSARVDELEELRILSDLSYLEFTRLVLDANKQSKTIVNLAHFVACDANGVPLDKPCEHDGCYLLTEAEAQKGECNTEKGCTCKILNQYNEAQKSVVFEGWEVFSINDYVIKVVKDNWLVGFCLKNKWVTITTLEAFNKNDWDSALNIQSLADLAAATTSNPIKLK